LHLPKGAAMTTPTGPGWQDGSYESGADGDGADEVPNPETGVGIGAVEGEPTTFEPEEPTDPAED
jgi:hypothetical protein